jgi:hypothetical protein
VAKPFAFVRSGRRVRPQAFRTEWRAKFSAAVSAAKEFGQR